MITPSNIVKHLKTYLPRITDLFTSKLTVLGATVSGGLTLSINAVGHGRTVGQNLVVASGTVRNPIIATMLNPDNTVRFLTQYDHDLTEPSQVNDVKNLTLGGFGNIWDGEHLIDHIPNRKSFDIALPAGETAAPTIDGNQYLIENRPVGLYGVQSVDTVIDPDNFTISLTGIPELPDGPIDDLEIITGYRIAAAESVDRAQDIYAKYDDLPYLFVIMGDLDISRDRRVDNDSVATLNRQNLIKLTGLQNFSTTIFLSTDNDISGSDAQELIYDEIYTSLLKVLHCYAFENSENAVDYVTISTGHGGGVYNTAFITHVYDWQSPFDMTSEIGFDYNADVAFRNIAQNIDLFGDNEAVMTSHINLDEEPL